MPLETFLKRIGQNIAKCRKASTRTQKDTAENVGISYRYYQSIESGAANITLSTLHRLASFFKVLPQELLPKDNEA